MDGYYYMDIVDGKVYSYGWASSVDEALAKTKGRLQQINEQEYMMLYALNGRVEKGVSVLEGIKKKLIEEDF